MEYYHDDDNPSPGCRGIISPSPSFYSPTVTVTCDSARPNDTSAWNTVKALYG